MSTLRDEALHSNENNIIQCVKFKFLMKNKPADALDTGSLVKVKSFLRSTFINRSSSQ